MPLLDRDLARVRARAITDIAGPLLERIVDFAVRAFRRCEVSASRRTSEENVHLAPLALFLHQIEMCDGILEWVRASAASPATPVLRSQFEAVISLEYMLAESFRLRSLAWLYFNVGGAIYSYELHDEDSERGRRLAPELQKVPIELSTEALAYLRTRLSTLTEFLQREQLTPIRHEVERLRKQKKRRSWHSLFDGPANFEAICRGLNRTAEYEVLYRRWSAHAHAEDVLRLLAPKASGEAPGWKEIRSPEIINEIAHYSALFLLRGLGLMIGHYREGERLDGWYHREVKSDLDRLREMDVNVIYRPYP